MLFSGEMAAADTYTVSNYLQTSRGKGTFADETSDSCREEFKWIHTRWDLEDPNSEDVDYAEEEYAQNPISLFLGVP